MAYRVHDIASSAFSCHIHNTFPTYLYDPIEDRRGSGGGVEIEAITGNKATVEFASQRGQGSSGYNYSMMIDILQSIFSTNVIHLSSFLGYILTHLHNSPQHSPWLQTSSKPKLTQPSLWTLWIWKDLNMWLKYGWAGNLLSTSIVTLLKYVAF